MTHTTDRYENGANDDAGGTDARTHQDGCMYGEWRQPVNVWAGPSTSIHTDETAKSVGMRGGTIPGIFHLNLFPPLLAELWGQRCFERGSLSMYYTYATTDREDVRAVIAIPPKSTENMQVEARVETSEGQTAAKGTVSVGDPEELSYLRKIKLADANPDELRILAGIKAGDRLPSRDVTLSQELAEKGLESIPADWLDWYKGESPWGASILSPSAMHRALAIRPMRPDGRPIQGVGFYGATELQNIEGPLKVGTPYRLRGKVVCVGVTSKTEYYWVDSYLEEGSSGRRVARMLHMDRFMKAGSPHYGGR